MGLRAAQEASMLITTLGNQWLDESPDSHNTTPTIIYWPNTQLRPGNLSRFCQHKEHNWKIYAFVRHSIRTHNCNRGGGGTMTMGADPFIQNSTHNDSVSSTAIMKHYVFQSFINPPGIYDNHVQVFQTQLWTTNIFPLIFHKATKLQISIVVRIMTIVT